MSTLSVNAAGINFGRYQALRGLSLSAADGQFVTLLGPSGCGKTTLLKAIAGFIPLNSGSISIGGVEMANVPPERRDTAMCFQSYALFPHLSVADNILFGLRQKGVPKAAQQTRLAEIAAQVSLGAQLDKLPGQLSGGQQQRVALARALAVRPGVMLFDEPLSNLDAKLRDQVRFEIRQLQRAHGFTAVYVTHDQAEALAMSDLVVVMNAGAIEQAGTPEDVYYRPVNRFVADFVGTANIMPVDVVGRDSSAGVYAVSTPMGPAQIRSDVPPVADRVYVCWRPEDGQLRDADASGVNVFPLVARTRTFLGSLTDMTLSLPGDTSTAYRIQQLGMVDLAPGAACSVSIAPDKLRMLQEAVS